MASDKMGAVDSSPSPLPAARRRVMLTAMAKALAKLVALLTPKRRWFQFRLRTLFVLVSVLCIPLAWLKFRIDRTYPQRVAAAELRRHGFGVEQRSLPGPIWLLRWIGDENLYYLQDVDFVRGCPTDDELRPLRALPYVRTIRIGFPDVTDAGLEHLARCTEATSVQLGHAKITDAGLQHLRHLGKLEHLGLAFTAITDASLELVRSLDKLAELDLRGTRVTDAGLAHLEPLSGLKVIHLDSTTITDKGLYHLKTLAKLNHVQVGNTQVTDAGVAELQKSLPECRIYFGRDLRLFVPPLAAIDCGNDRP